MQTVDIRKILEGVDGPDVDMDELADDENLVQDMVDFILNINPDILDDNQAEQLDNIISRMEYYEDPEEGGDDLDEAAPPKRVRRDLKAKRERSREYRRHKAQLKLKAKKYRKSAHGKLLAKKRKRMAKRGLTATGQRKRTYINK
jgi:hypothetical protein